MDLSKTGYAFYRKLRAGRVREVSQGPKRLTDKKRPGETRFLHLDDARRSSRRARYDKEANSESFLINGEPRMVGISRTKRVSEVIYGFSVLFLAGCTPLYMWDTHVTSTPRPESVGVAELTRETVATLGPLNRA